MLIGHTSFTRHLAPLQSFEDVKLIPAFLRVEVFTPIVRWIEEKLIPLLTALFGVLTESTKHCLYSCKSYDSKT